MNEAKRNEGERPSGVVAKPVRRRFTVEYKRNIVREADGCKTPGAVARPLVFGANVSGDPNVVSSLRAGGTLAGEDYSNVTVREGGLWGNAMRLAGVEGQTFGNTVLLMPGGSGNTLLDLHELGHVSQYRAFGFVGFLAQYISWSAQYGYVDNPFEIAARDFAGY